MAGADIIFLVGRLLFGGFFLVNGVSHFTRHSMLSGYAASKGVPAPKLLVAVSGLFILLGGLGILMGAYMEWAVALIAIFLVVVTFKMHNFWADTDPMTKMSNTVNFMKNLALLGGALMILSVPQPWLYGLNV